ncbi:hypothetical protein [Lentzea sp. NPDC055074]
MPRDTAARPVGGCAAGWSAATLSCGGPLPEPFAQWAAAARKTGGLRRGAVNASISA